jgi:REP element-mobilizing transposase RayT
MQELRYSRGYLPHIEVDNRPQFVTWRLHDAVPEHLIQQWQLELASQDQELRGRELARRIEKYSDLGHGSCLLKEMRAARAMQEHLFELHGKSLVLHAWCVMPNHVHSLFTPLEQLGPLMQRIKGASARKINLAMDRNGKLWQREYFDRYIRDEEHFRRVSEYVEWNPAKANLVEDPALYSWSSANANAKQRLEFLSRD